MKGAGIWLRKVTDIAPTTAAEYLDFAVVALHSGERGSINRGPSMRDWCEAFRLMGGTVHAMDWLPDAGRPPLHLASLADAARLIGAKSIMADLEPDAGWRHATKEVEDYARELVYVAGDSLGTSITDYGKGGMSRKTLSTALALVPTGVPQSYDPNGAMATGYHAKNVAYWRDRGAQDIVLGVGLWLQGERRHRTPAEFLDHISDAPGDLDAICAWYAAGDGKRSVRALTAVLPMLREWSSSRIGSRHTEPAPPRFDRGRIEQLATEASEAGDDKAAHGLLDALARLGEGA